MKIKTKVMYLGSRSGNTEDGKTYYLAQYLDKNTNSNFRVYYNSPDSFKNLEPYKDYDIEFEFYLNQKGLWAVRGV